MIRLGCGLISGFVHGGHFNPSPSYEDIRAQDPYLIYGLHATVQSPGFSVSLWYKWLLLFTYRHKRKPISSQLVRYAG